LAHAASGSDVERDLLAFGQECAGRRIPPAVGVHENILAAASGAKAKAFGVLKNSRFDSHKNFATHKFPPGGMPERVEMGRSKAKEVTVSSRRPQLKAAGFFYRCGFVCDGLTPVPATIRARCRIGNPVGGESEAAIAAARRRKSQDFRGGHRICRPLWHRGKPSRFHGFHV